MAKNQRRRRSVSRRRRKAPKLGMVEVVLSAGRQSEAKKDVCLSVQMFYRLKDEKERKARIAEALAEMARVLGAR